MAGWLAKRMCFYDHGLVDDSDDALTVALLSTYLSLLATRFSLWDFLLWLANELLMEPQRM